MITHVIVELKYPVKEEYLPMDTIFPSEYYGYGTPLIRCKDCKWFVHDDDCYGDCSNEGGAKGFVYTTDYCSRAERKEE